jgi:hypothetical protein
MSPTVDGDHTASANTIRRYHLYNSTGKEVEPEKSEGEKDIGVLVDDQLTFSQDIFNSRRTR